MVHFISTGKSDFVSWKVRTHLSDANVKVQDGCSVQQQRCRPHNPVQLLSVDMLLQCVCEQNTAKYIVINRYC